VIVRWAFVTGRLAHAWREREGGAWGDSLCGNRAELTVTIDRAISMLSDSEHDDRCRRCRELANRSGVTTLAHPSRWPVISSRVVEPLDDLALASPDDAPMPSAPKRRR
jgi:hypothetical protein